MITIVRTIEITPGKEKEATEIARKQGQYINDHYAKTQVMRNIGGQLNQLHWVVNYESLVAMEAFRKKITADADFQVLIAKGEGLFVGGSAFDSIFEVIS